MLVSVPADLAEKARLRAERERKRKSTYQDRRPRHDRKIPYNQYPFVMWDGEAPKDTGYSLFGSSLGHEILHPRLHTEECFDILLEAKRENPESIFVMFGSRYDFDEIIRQDMPSDRLARIKWHGSVTWHGYTVTQAEGKWFSIRKDGTTVKVFEIFGWFHTTYVKALRKYQIGTPEEWDLLDSEKNRRSKFMWSEIDEIRQYMRLELKLGPPLMERIRDICLTAGFNPRSWYGPSALATEMLRRNGVRKYMAVCPPKVNEAARFAYAAGRFEMFRGGILSPVYSKDMNSAYMRAALELPDLAHGTWRRGKEYEPGKFALYKIRFRDTESDAMTPMPLFRRMSNGTVCWPKTVENWYWSPEAALVQDDPRASFLDTWVFDEDNSHMRPFSFVKEIYRKRMVLESLPESNPSHAAGQAFKWGLASIYGQLCRTVGWGKFTGEPPRYHQLEWAGYITSWCRAEQYKVALACGDKLISIDTDSVTAMTPVTGYEGSELGEWKASYADRGVFYQSGVYFTEYDGQWTGARLRGIEMRGKKLPVSADMLITAIRNGTPVRVSPKTRYISIRQSLGWGLKLQGQWVTPKDLETLHFGGKGKRYHNKCMCSRLCNGDVHVFLPFGSIREIEPGNPVIDWERILYSSKPHDLPWVNGPNQNTVPLVRDVLWIDTERQEQDDYWQMELL